MTLSDPITRTTFSDYCAGKLRLVYRQTHFVDWQDIAKQGFCILVTHGSDMTVTDAMAAELPENVVHWFTVNCGTTDSRVSPLPIGLRANSANDAVIQMMRDAKANPGRLAYLCATWDNPNLPESVRCERKMLYERFGKEDWVTVKGGHRIGDVPFDEFCADVKGHKFVFSPRGAGQDTHRAFEAMYLGSIPILRRHRAYDLFKDMPVLFVHDWSQVTPQLLQREHKRLSVMFDMPQVKLTASYWTNKIHVRAMSLR